MQTQGKMKGVRYLSVCSVFYSCSLVTFSHFNSYIYIHYVERVNLAAFSLHFLTTISDILPTFFFFLRYHTHDISYLTLKRILFLHLLYTKIKVTDDVTIFDILDNRDQGISNAVVNSQATQSVVHTYVEGVSGKHCFEPRQ